MKKIVLLFCLFTSTILFPQSDPLRSFLGIPIITYGGDITVPYVNQYHFDKIDSAGIFALQVNNLTPTSYTNHLSGNQFKLIPEQMDASGYIEQYTEARYSIWLAEGTDPANGKATLFHNDTISEKWCGYV